MLKPRGSPDSAAMTVPRRVVWAEVSCVNASSTQHNMPDARGESRTLMGLPPTDFEYVASAIPPLGPRGGNIDAGPVQCVSESAQGSRFLSARPRPGRR